VTLIIPFPAGGAMDLLGRGVAQELGDKLGAQNPEALPPARRLDRA
jgi:tripartite-type tricarboxylate transporter receptor subunit TctC